MNDTRDRVRVTFSGGEPPESAKQYLVELKERKQEAVLYLKDLSDPLKAIFNKACIELNKIYIDGTTPFIEANHKELAADIARSEDRLNDLWINGLNGQATIKQFREELKRYYKLNLTVAELYKKEKGLISTQEASCEAS